MRRMVLVFLFLGLVAGSFPLAWELIYQNFVVSNVVEYDGVYEPLRGVEMSRAYQTTLDLSFALRSGMSNWILPSAFAMSGAALGAAAGFIAARRGFRLTRAQPQSQTPHQAPHSNR